MKSTLRLLLLFVAIAITGVISLVPFPIISRNVPASSSTVYNTGQEAFRANDADYGTTFRSLPVVIGTTPQWLAYDISGVLSARKTKMLLVWYNPSYQYYNAQFYNNPLNYEIRGNAAAGGTVPTTGWVTIVNVTANNYKSRQHILNTNGNYNWIQLYVTAPATSPGNEGVEVNMDIYDASGAIEDDWLLVGDSITAGAMRYATVAGVLPIHNLVRAQSPNFNPVIEDGGMPGYTTGSMAPIFPTFISMFPGKYVSIALGTNDANTGSPNPTGFKDAMRSLANQVLAAGKIPIIPPVIYGTATNLQNNVPTYNQALNQLYNESRGCIVRGPDLYAYFSSNPSYISTDTIHPTDQGYGAYRTFFATWMVQNFYNGSYQYPAYCLNGTQTSSSQTASNTNTNTQTNSNSNTNTNSQTSTNSQTNTQPSSTTGCAIGHLGCACAAGDVCLEGLKCATNPKVCVQIDSTSDVHIIFPSMVLFAVILLMI